MEEGKQSDTFIGPFLELLEVCSLLDKIKYGDRKLRVGQRISLGINLIRLPERKKTKRRNKSTIKRNIRTKQIEDAKKMKRDGLSR